MKVNENIKNWYNNGGKGKIAMYMEDPDGIFSTETGSKAGVYGAYVLTPEERLILMYVGEVGRANRGFKDRLVEHAKYWIENPEFYTGLKVTELQNGYKYLVRILAEETDDDKRYAMEQSMVEEYKPYLQFSCYPKFDSGYRGYDLAIFGSYRRRAFLIARDGKYIEDKKELFINNVFNLKDKVDFNQYRNVKPHKDVVILVEQEMPKGSDIWRDIKKCVESNMHITSERGCSYSYLVKVVAAALETTYMLEYEL